MGYTEANAHEIAHAFERSLHEMPCNWVLVFKVMC